MVRKRNPPYLQRSRHAACLCLDEMPAPALRPSRARASFSRFSGIHGSAHALRRSRGSGGWCVATPLASAFSSRFSTCSHPVALSAVDSPAGKPSCTAVSVVVIVIVPRIAGSTVSITTSPQETAVGVRVRGRLAHPGARVAGERHPKRSTLPRLEEVHHAAHPRRNAPPTHRIRIQEHAVDGCSRCGKVAADPTRARACRDRSAVRGSTSRPTIVGNVLLTSTLEIPA